MVLVVEVDVGGVLPADGDERHASALSNAVRPDAYSRSKKNWRGPSPRGGESRERPQSITWARRGLCARRQPLRAVASCRREVMLSFRNTLPRWYSTVDVVTNRRVAISALVTLAAARRAICVSCGVRSGPASSAGYREVAAHRQELRTAAARKRRGPHGVEQFFFFFIMRAGMAAAFLAAQPFAVQQMGTGEFRAHRGSGQVRYGLRGEVLGAGSRGPAAHVTGPACPAPMVCRWAVARSSEAAECRAGGAVIAGARSPASTISGRTRLPNPGGSPS